MEIIGNTTSNVSRLRSVADFVTLAFTGDVRSRLTSDYTKSGIYIPVRLGDYIHRQGRRSIRRWGRRRRNGSRVRAIRAGPAHFARARIDSGTAGVDGGNELESPVAHGPEGRLNFRQTNEERVEGGVARERIAGGKHRGGRNPMSSRLLQGSSREFPFH